MRAVLPRLYFNKNFAVTTAQIKAVNAGGRYVTLASHSDPEHPMLHAAHEALTEPRGLLGDAYVDWLLDTCARLRVDAFLVGKEPKSVARRAAEFEARGVHLIVPADADTLTLLDHKDQFLAGWDADLLPIPAWTTFRDAAAFEGALAALRADPAFVPGRTRLCVKPARGIYASGFRVLTDGDDLRAFLEGNLYQMSTAEARRLFAQPDLPTMLLMHTLEGPERSVDCVAWRGELAAAVVRRKGAGDVQVLEDRPDLVEAARQIARTYGLSGIFNFQTKDDGAGRANMLEINARASGGLRYSLMAGVNYAEWAADLARGVRGPADFPAPRTGLRVREVKGVEVVQAVEVPA
ncbi:ATP-grasp domain-containing protein [Deinococcus maricopensis]|uniref:ATP-grasp domain-containing protein n=1 Tax=Deinococcus maricopensis (strain DSM 21211 / LMG 22137 / NRRL B-23946 / LB-34) TaxID=709986 RepID=E8U3T8_DEIML|nr:ATP-grasp domain-containing protein [Deinococcus maricopensis]ADV68781.1 hypothetical protein Deima_3153 [Deinococcus maricopensis DSM 21211]